MANILFVVADKALPTTGEAALKSLLEGSADAHVVTYASDNDAEVSQDDYDCAILSDSCNFGLVAFGTAYRTNWRKGVIVGATGWPKHQLSGTLSSTSRDNIAIADPGSPLAAGLTSPVTIFTASHNMGCTATVGAGADVVFKLSSSSSLYPIFTYEVDQLLTDGSPAPGRRIAMGLKEASWPNLTADGQTLWLNAVSWAAETLNTAPVVTITSPSADLTVPAGTKIVLEFSVTDEDAGLAASARVVSSDVTDGTSGSLGTGSPLTIDTTGWVNGPRTITVTATDSGDLEGSSDFLLNVGTASAISPYLKARAAVAPLGGF